eukprot:TRINITY_DN58264_c0_g1_i1.p3 TRINITY_DN58264_c0_g1~~TRINITY_DN58264_c0_g1_i1.p3  ORF type:complete len:145 (+),score=52.67 TRINITY_DN58264_c0_g1_i1:54-437(+)
MAEACVKNMTGNAPLKYMPFAQCVEADGSSESLAELQKCAEKLGFDWTTVHTCMTGTQGKHLMDIEGRKTDAANIQYTPYIACNGKAVRSAERITKTVCNLWTGTKPPCCSRADAVREVNATRSYPQ